MFLKYIYTCARVRIIERSVRAFVLFLTFLDHFGPFWTNSQENPSKICIYQFFVVILPRKIEGTMRTTQEYIATLKQHAPILRERFGMTSMSLFGSVARGNHTEDSDIDVFVEMPATLRGVGAANDYLEQITGRHVDMILKHRNLTPFFLQEVERDGVRIF